MIPLRFRAITCALGALALAASSLALAAPAAAASEPCTVKGATLEWGFKESFRAYIDGSIANGEWTVTDPASYETPTFTWSRGTATIDQDAHTAEVTFEGSVRFTGHDGLLDTTIADPIVRIAADGTATVLLDVSGPTMEGDPIDVDAAEFVEGPIGQFGAESPQVIELPAPALTADGATAFPNYEAGTAFDDATLTIPASQTDCRFELPADPASTWLAVGLGVVGGAGVIALVIALVIGQLRRARA